MHGQGGEHCQDNYGRNSGSRSLHHKTNQAFLIFCARALKNMGRPGNEANTLHINFDTLLYMFRTDGQPCRLCNRTPVIQPDSRLRNRTSG